MKHKHVAIALVGLPGSGKTEVGNQISKAGFNSIRFGDITEKALIKKGLEVNEKNERNFREGIRKKLGMAAYAILNLPEIITLLDEGSLIIDGLYSWEEYLELKKELKDRLVLVHVYANPNTRYSRLAKRKHRSLTKEEAKSRDYAEIENLNKGGPIAIADYILDNQKGKDDIATETEKLLNAIKKNT